MNFAPDGLKMIGERGPDLVNLPRGSRVRPNNPPVIIPAETLQPADEHPVITLRFGVGMAVLSAVLMGVHLAWVRAGMPGPSEILTAIMETLK